MHSPAELCIIPHMCVCVCCIEYVFIYNKVVLHELCPKIQKLLKQMKDINSGKDQDNVFRKDLSCLGLEDIVYERKKC